MVFARVFLAASFAFVGLGLAWSATTPLARRLTPVECQALGGSQTPLNNARCDGQTLAAHYCGNKSLGCGPGPYDPPTLGQCFTCDGDPATRRFCAAAWIQCLQYDPPVVGPLVSCPKRLGKCVWSESTGAYRCVDYEVEPSGNCNTVTRHLCFYP